MMDKSLHRKTMHLIVLFIFGFFIIQTECVQSPPTMIKQPPKEQLYQVAISSDEVDRPFTLECEARGDPEPTYRWIKNGLEFNYVAYDKRINQQPRRGTLTFTKPDHVDEGLYQCFAENKHGISVSNAVFLRKSELNSFPDEDIIEKEAKEGEPLTLDCNPPTGYPKPSIFWIVLSNTGALRSLNSSRLTVDPEGRLHYSNVTKQDIFDDSTYACSATSIYRTEYKVGRRTILRLIPSGSSGPSSYPPFKQYVSPPLVPALREQRLELHCIFGGTPLPDVVWRKRSGSLEGSHYTYVNYGKTLVINKVEYSDEGTYECTASNGVGSQISHAIQVTVQAAPFWVAAPNNTNAAEGEMVRFECIASGNPEPKLQWFVNGDPIEKASKNPRRKVEGNVLTIENLIETQDTAVYQCNASNVHGYAFRDFYLNVLKLPPTIIENPEPVTRAVVTSNIILRCRVFGAPRPKVSWKKDEIELTGGKYNVLPEGDLEIKNVIVSDQGEYTCNARNKFGETSTKGRLEVKGKTRITRPPENFEVAARKMAVFRCNAEVDASLELKIDWLFNGKAIDYDHDPRLVKSTDNSLTITTTRELDSGIYTCVARTDLDTVTADATLIVQDVPNAPQIKNVECEALAALVEWQPMGDRRAPILSYSIQMNTSFAPDNWVDAFVNIPAPDTRFKVAMSPWANYTFRVIARNKIGASEPSGPSERCTTEEDVPFKNPENVIGRGDRPDNLVIRWTPMTPIEHNAPNFVYKVFWKRIDEPNAKPWNTKVINDWQQNSFVIPNQPTFKPYRIKVEAHNRRGQAHIQATEVIGYSGEDKPLQIPQNFQLVEIRDARTAKLRWDHVMPDSVRGHFRGYKIQTWVEGEDEKYVREVSVPSNASEAIVSVFKPFSRNYARIFVYNDAYSGDPSPTITINTPEGTPGPVANFEGFPMSSNALFLTWEHPEEKNGQLMGYKIYYEEVRGTQIDTKLERPPINNPQVTSAKLVGLKPSTRYRVTVHAFTKVGNGDPFYIELETKSQDEIMLPAKPNFDFTNIPGLDGKNDVRITWYPRNEEGKSSGSYFYVQYRLKGTEQWLNTPKDEAQDSFDVVIRGLDPDQTYEVRVVAVDGSFEMPSDIKEVTSSGITAHISDHSHLANFAPWFIGMMCAIALVIVLVVLVCIVKRNRGGKYSVHEKEAAQGKDLDYEEAGFNEYNKYGGPGRGESRPLDESLHQGESDTDSMAEEDNINQFCEDGSYIGAYDKKNHEKEYGIATSV